MKIFEAAKLGPRMGRETGVMRSDADDNDDDDANEDGAEEEVVVASCTNPWSSSQ